MIFRSKYKILTYKGLGPYGRIPERISRGIPEGIPKGIDGGIREQTTEGTPERIQEDCPRKTLHETWAEYPEEVLETSINEFQNPRIFFKEKLRNYIILM